MVIEGVPNSALDMGAIVPNEQTSQVHKDNLRWLVIKSDACKFVGVHGHLLALVALMSPVCRATW